MHCGRGEKEGKEETHSPTRPDGRRPALPQRSRPRHQPRLLPRGNPPLRGLAIPSPILPPPDLLRHSHTHNSPRRPRRPAQHVPARPAPPPASTAGRGQHIRCGAHITSPRTPPRAPPSQTPRTYKLLQSALADPCRPAPYIPLPAPSPASSAHPPALFVAPPHGLHPFSSQGQTSHFCAPDFPTLLADA